VGIGRKEEREKKMGQGKGGDHPLKNLLRRLNNQKIPLNKKIDRTRDAIINFCKENGINSLYVNNDIMQTVIESRNKKVLSGRDLWRNIQQECEFWLRIPFCHTIQINIDCNKSENRAKEMCYFTIGSKRRIGVKPMIFKHDESRTPPGPILITDDSIPDRDSWKRMKMNPTLRKQINWYVAKKFCTEISIGNKIKGLKTVIIDNCVNDQYLFHQDKKTTPYFRLVISYLDGKRHSIKKIKATGISEGELAMSYSTKEVKISPLTQKPENIILLTADQDIVPIELANSKTRFFVDPDTKKKVWKNRVFVCMPKRKKITKTQWERSYLLIDMNLMYERIIETYSRKFPSISNPIESELFLWYLGGCDTNDKPFHGVGYQKFIYKTWEENITEYGKMISMIEGQSIELSNGVIFNGELPLVDLKLYRKFAKRVFRTKLESFKTAKTKKKWKKAFSKQCGDSLYIIPRQIMFQIYWITNIPKIRFEQDVVPVLSPFTKGSDGESLWGYELVNAENCHCNPVCGSAKSVSSDFQI